MPRAKKTSVNRLSWIVDVSESPSELGLDAPIFVKLYEQKHLGESSAPAQHPYCELNVLLEGDGISFVENEEKQRSSNGVLLLGPGVPHWGKVTKFPFRSITVYFLPSILLEFCNPHVSVSILRRFTASRTLDDRLVSVPPAMHRSLVLSCREMLKEFRAREFGWELRSGAILFTEIIRLIRWETARGRLIGEGGDDLDWRPVVLALRHLREHYTTQIYSKDVAEAAGISETRLKIIFRNALGMPWVKYLQIYRSHRAALLLCEGKLNITEIAYSVGFESLSHFNLTFRATMGVSPSEYEKKIRGTKKQRVENLKRRL
jgi:AraC-like DNA-binding protein